MFDLSLSIGVKTVVDDGPFSARTEYDTNTGKFETTITVHSPSSTTFAVKPTIFDVY